MSVYKMVEVVGTSGTSISDAVRGAISRASQTLDDVEWFEVTEIRGRVAQGEVSEYQVKLDIGFRLRAPKEETGATGSARADKRKPTGSRQARSARAQVAAKKGERARSELSRSFRQQPRRGRA